MYYDDGSPDVRIKETLCILQKTKSEMHEKELVLSALEDSLVNMVNSRPFIFRGELLRNAHQQQKNKKKSERSAYELIKEHFLEQFFDDTLVDDVKLKEIMQTGLDAYAYSFIFDLYGFTFEIKIPASGNINKQNLSYCHYGQFAIGYQKNTSTWVTFKTSYDAKDITNALKEFID